MQQRIVAAEHAISSANVTGSGHETMWMNGSDTYVLIADANAGVGSGDDLIKLVGVDISHVHLVNGALVAV